MVSSTQAINAVSQVRGKNLAGLLEDAGDCKGDRHLKNTQQIKDWKRQERVHITKYYVFSFRHLFPFL